MITLPTSPLYFSPDVTKCKKTLQDLSSRYQKQIDVIEAVLNSCATYKRGSLDGWYKRHIETNTFNVKVYLYDHGRMTYVSPDMTFDDQLSVYGDNFADHNTNLQKRLQDLQQRIKDINILLPQLPDLAKLWTEAAQTLTNIVNVPGMHALNDQFVGLKNV